MSLAIHPIALVQRSPVDTGSVKLTPLYEPKGDQYQSYKAQHNANTSTDRQLGMKGKGNGEAN